MSLLSPNETAIRRTWHTPIAGHRSCRVLAPRLSAVAGMPSRLPPRRRDPSRVPRKLQRSPVVAARCSAPLSFQGFRHSARYGRTSPPVGVCYRALRRLPEQDFHLLEQRVFQDAPSHHCIIRKQVGASVTKLSSAVLVRNAGQSPPAVTPPGCLCVNPEYLQHERRKLERIAPTRWAPALCAPRRG